MPNPHEPFSDKTASANPQKIFRLAPVEDDLTSLILSARMDTLCNRQLSRPARLMFVLLLDLSVRRSTNVEPGVVRISDAKLAALIGTSRKAVSRWKAELLKLCLVWTSSHYMPNAWPITTYHVSALCKRDPHTEKTTEAGIWGNGQKRGNLVRPTPLWDTGVPSAPKTAQNAQVPEMTPGKGHQCPAPRDASDAGQGTPVSPGKGRQCPAPGVTSVPPPASPVSLAAGRLCPLPGVTSVPRKEAEDGEFSHPKGVLSVQRDSTLKKSVGGTGRKAGEAVFLLDVKAACDQWRKSHGKEELENSGAWWRLGYRADPDLMRRVLAETLRAVKEGQVKTTPGQYAADLWKRWGGTLEAGKNKGEV